MTSFSTCRSPEAWLRQLVLCLGAMICHSSVRVPWSNCFETSSIIGSRWGPCTTSCTAAVTPGRAINQQYDLSRILVGLFDEIFQASDPVFVGVDAESTFCFLLSPEQHCDADTWGHPAFAGTGRPRLCSRCWSSCRFRRGTRARAQRKPLPGVPCRGDIFHALYTTIGPLVRYLEKQAYAASSTPGPALASESYRSLDVVVAAAKEIRGLPQKHYGTPGRLKPRRSRWLMRWRHCPGCGTTSCRWPVRSTPSAAICLTSWWRSCWPAGRLARTRSSRSGPCWRIEETTFLAFTVQLDRDLENLAQEWQISVATAREVLQVQYLPTWDSKRWPRVAALRETLRGRYHGWCADVRELSDRVVRASSMVENLNSRLRTYFFLREGQLGNDFLTLLQFFLNHRRYLCAVEDLQSSRQESCGVAGRVSPTAHWLELLGYTRFSQT